MILLSYFFVQPITIYESLFPLEEIMKEELVAACSRPTPEIEQQEPEVQFVTEPVFKGARPMIQIRLQKVLNFKTKYQCIDFQ